MLMTPLPLSASRPPMLATPFLAVTVPPPNSRPPSSLTAPALKTLPPISFSAPFGPTLIPPLPSTSRVSPWQGGMPQTESSTTTLWRPEAPPIVRLRATPPMPVLLPTSTPYSPASVIFASQVFDGRPLLQLASVLQPPPLGFVHSVVPFVQTAAEAELAGTAATSSVATRAKAMRMRMPTLHQT